MISVSESDFISRKFLEPHLHQLRCHGSGLHNPPLHSKLAQEATGPEMKQMRLIIKTPPFLLLSIVQRKSRRYTTFQGKSIRFHLSMRGTEKSHCKGYT